MSFSKFTCVVGSLVVLAVPTFIASAGPASKSAEPAWADPMRKVHAAHKGKDCYVAQLGDSITVSMAFWSPLDWHDLDQHLPEKPEDGLPKRPEGKRWRDVIGGIRDKGPEHGSNGGWRTGNVLKVIDKVLADKQPAIAIVMIGTNDISANKVPANYRADLETIIRKCTAAGCVPILNTIPPRKATQKAAEEANEIIRDVAKQANVPLADYYAEILKRRPGTTWDGTLVSPDGVHPSAGKTQIMTEENLKESGYALRTWVNFLAVREVYFRVIASGVK